MASKSHGSPSDSIPSEGGSPANPSQGRKGNDSLWKRARRTLGTSSLTFLQPQSRSTKGNKSDSGGGPAAPSKRREQVRHAQRTHRQRTQNYIKTLESEVVRLRGSETTLTQEKNNLQGKIDILRTTCLLAGIPLPAGIEDTAASPSQRAHSQESATISMHADDMNNQRLHVDWPSPQASGAPRAPQMQSPTDPPNPAYSQYDHSQPAASPPDGEPSPSKIGKSAEYEQDFSLQPLSFTAPSSQIVYTNSNPLLDTPDIAIDFVLALEHPCVSHIPHPSNTTHDPTNHILLASTPLVACSARPPQPDAHWTASAAMIKELLNLSRSINLKGELTPVEAWHRLRGHPEFGKLDLQSLGTLKTELSRIVRCCGFGAVLDEALFWETLNRVLFLTTVRPQYF